MVNHWIARSVLVAGLAAAALPVAAADLKVGVREFGSGAGNPYTGCPCTPQVFVWSAVYEQLTRIGPQGESAPLLAESWKNVSPTTWDVTLRPGVKFSNGEAMTADAVVASYAFLWTDAGKATANGKQVGTIITKVTKVDDRTVRFETKEPDAIFTKRIREISILPPKHFSDVGLEGFTLKPIGSGPYLVEYKPESASATRNPSAWRPVTGNVDRISWTVMPEGAARAQALGSKQIDIDVSTSADDIARLKQAGMEIYAKTATRTLGLSLVSVRDGKPVTGPLADKRVRQALNYAVNKQSIVDNIFGGNGAPATQGATPVVYGYNPAIKGYPYDPVRAKQLLTEAGYANGMDLEFHAIMTDSAFAQAYQAAVQDLTRVGVRVKLVSEPFSEWFKYWNNGQWPHDGFGLGHDLTGSVDAGRAFDNYTSCKRGGGTAENPKAAYYCNPAEMPLVNALSVELDPAKREKMLNEALATLTDGAPVIFLVEFKETMGFNPKIKNFSHINLWIPYEELRIDG